ncbi:hypothetical protein [Fredinandcohnia quinoae]|uniref:hypothetical protein n=1 Tax=Fredinandcohnia quinoae TaxID=2918902 RepID=UPI001F0670D4|nr:hypothetical protein [Fredinandcohnia sp. SECRCQ15]
MSKDYYIVNTGCKKNQTNTNKIGGDCGNSNSNNQTMRGTAIKLLISSATMNLIFEIASRNFKNGICANMAYKRKAISGEIVQLNLVATSSYARPKTPPASIEIPYIQIC